MRVRALDHVNIICADLAGTARFYAELLGLEARNAPPPLKPSEALWLHDSADRPVIHLNAIDCPRRYDRDVTGETTGAIHHVALDCEGHDEMLARLAARGLDWQVNEVAAIGLRQIFTIDPNGVLLELNFREG